MICSVLCSGGAAATQRGPCAAMPVPVLPEMVHDRNNKTKRKKNIIVPARINYLMLIANRCLLYFVIFPSCFLFFKWLWIYKYVLLMMCSGTKYSHGNFFYTRDVSNFLFFYILVVLIGGWLGLMSHCVSASNKRWRKKLQFIACLLSYSSTFLFLNI